MEGFKDGTGIWWSGGNDSNRARELENPKRGFSASSLHFILPNYNRTLVLPLDLRCLLITDVALNPNPASDRD